MRLPFVLSAPVRTARLELRHFCADDLDPLFAMHSDPDVVRYVPFPPRDRAGTAEVLGRKSRSTRLAEDDDLFELAVALRPGGEVIGDLLLALRSVEHQTLEVGYMFSRHHGGHGYATEAVSALLDLAFGDLGARRLVARVDERNGRSCALLERLGLRREAHLVENEWVKGELTSEIDYAILAREWA
ncbi:MAG: GNAT family N-acetyltransferase [Kineosporiaceae bacterium]